VNQHVVLVPLFDDQIGHSSFQHIIAIFSKRLMYQAEKFQQNECSIERFFLHKKGFL